MKFLFLYCVVFSALFYNVITGKSIDSSFNLQNYCEFRIFDAILKYALILNKDYEIFKNYWQWIQIQVLISFCLLLEFKDTSSSGGSEPAKTCPPEIGLKCPMASHDCNSDSDCKGGKDGKDDKICCIVGCVYKCIWNLFS